MEAIGGVVFRRALSDVKHTIHKKNVNAMKADLAQMKAEHAQAQADRKAKLHEKMLDSKIQMQLQKVKDRREAAERQARANGTSMIPVKTGHCLGSAGTRIEVLPRQDWQKLSSASC